MSLLLVKHVFFYNVLAAVMSGSDTTSPEDEQCAVDGSNCGEADKSSASVQPALSPRERYEQQLEDAAEQEEHWKGQSAKRKWQAQVMGKLKLNVLMSDALPLQRSLPDVRSKACKKKVYPAMSLRASVVVPFYNEAGSVLLRTAQSILDRTPESLLMEILLVDDGSDAPWSKQVRKDVQNFTSMHRKVQLVQSRKHLGLMPAKMEGYRKASGEVLIFLDSHCEVNVGWLEPLLDRINEDEHAVTVPVIDSIDAHSFAYSPGLLTFGVLSPGLYFAGRGHFNATDDRRLQAGEPAALPAMPGGLFAISRAYFETLGGYDEGLRIWGAENTELSFKVWRCLEGRVELHPCSHVGHIFKAVDHRFPSGQSLHKNYRRIADVWLDEYRDIYLKAWPLAASLRAGNLSFQRSVRKRNACKSFQWYLENIDPGFFVPRDPVQEGLLVSMLNDDVALSVAFGQALASNPFQYPDVLTAEIGDRSHFSDYNYWFALASGRIVHLGIWIEECLGARKTKGKWSVLVCQCAIAPGSGCTEDEIEWDVLPVQDGDTKGFQLKHRDAYKCLSAGRKPTYGSSLTLESCKNKGTRWRAELHPSPLPALQFHDEDDEDDEIAEAHNKQILR